MLYPQGDQGFAGEPGIQGLKGEGEPGPKVRKRSSLFRAAGSTENQRFSGLCFVQGEPGPNGTDGTAGIPGEDGAIGPKVSS